jgi:hypothetical protein
MRLTGFLALLALIGLDGRDTDGSLTRQPGPRQYWVWMKWEVLEVANAQPTRAAFAPPFFMTYAWLSRMLFQLVVRRGWFPAQKSPIWAGASLRATFRPPFLFQERRGNPPISHT